MERQATLVPGTNTPWQSALALLILPVSFFLVIAPHFFALWQTNYTQEESSPALEIRLVKSPQWKNDCLSIGLDRINHSSLPLFLPDMGLYISTSVTELRDDARKKDGQVWINVYGMSDVVSWEATAIAPGATVHNERCLPSKLFVVNLENKTRREIPLRGRLRIEAYYFLTEKDWQQNKSDHEEMFRKPPDQVGKRIIHDPKVATLFATIPCRELRCDSICNDPPLVLPGENRVVPDVFYLHSDWEARGNKIGDELASKSPPCAEANPAPR